MWWWGVAGSCAGLAVGAGLAERRRTSRTDPDRVGLIDWRGVQLFAAAAAIVAISVALHV